MNPENTSVLLIYTGGTIGMIENAETGALESFNFEQLQKHVPELQRFAFRIDTYQFDPPMDSSDMDPDAWRKLVRIISNNYNQYTGFVILHGTDTMAYTASALSFMLEGLNNVSKWHVWHPTHIPCLSCSIDSCLSIFRLWKASIRRGHVHPVLRE